MVYKNVKLLFLTETLRPREKIIQKGRAGELCGEKNQHMMLIYEQFWGKREVFENS